MDEPRVRTSVRRMRGGAAAVMVLAAVAAFAVRERPRDSSSPAERPGVEEDGSIDAGPEAAVRMVDRIQLFRTGGAGRRLELDGADLTALLRHAVPGMIPEGVRDPSVHLDGEEISVRARVSPSQLPGGEALGDVVAVLPDDVEVELRGTLHRSGPSQVEYRIEHASFGGVPLPSGVVAALVRSWPGGSGDDGDATPALRAAWSVRDGVVTVRDGVLVVERPEPILVQSVDGSDGV